MEYKIRVGTFLLWRAPLEQELIFGALEALDLINGSKSFKVEYLRFYLQQ